MTARRAQLTLAAAGLIAVCAALLARRVRVDTDLAALLPGDMPSAQGLRELGRVLARDELLVVLVEGDEAAVVASGADEMVRRLSANPEVASVRAGIGPSALDYLRRHRFLLLPDATWREVARRAGDARFARRVRAILNSPGGAAAMPALADDPLGLAELVARGAAGARGIDAATGRFASADGRAALVLVEGRRPAADLAAAQRLVAAVRGAGEALEGVRVGATGAPAYAVAYARAVRRDLAVSSIASLIAILILWGVAFRALGVLPVVAACLGFSYVVTLAVWAATAGHIGALALAFGAILLGIGVDVPIQLWSRIREELAAGHGPAEAVRRALGTLRAVSVLATLGPVAVFAACGLSRFPALRELGALAALGLLVNLIVTLTVLPAALVATERLWARPKAGGRGERWLERLASACARRRRVVLSVVAIAVLVFAWLGRLRYVPHPLAFETALEPSRVEDRVEQRFGARRGRTIVIQRAGSIDAALAINERLVAELREIEPQGVEALSDLLPSRATQEARRRRAMRESASIERNMRATFAAEGLEADAFAPFYKSLREPALAGLADLQQSDLGLLLRAHAGRGDDGAWLLATSVAARTDAAREQVARVARQKDAVPTGVPLVEAEIAGALPPDLRRVSAASVGVVVLLLLLHYRRLRPALLVLLPLSAAWAAFVALSPRLSVWNVLALPLVIGYGIDDHVFLVDRALEEGSGGVRRALRLTGRAVVLTSLATLAGFASLLLSSFSGIRALGWAGALAVGLCLAAALIVLPALVGGDAE